MASSLYACQLPDAVSQTHAQLLALLQMELWSVHIKLLEVPVLAAKCCFWYVGPVQRQSTIAQMNLHLQHQRLLTA